MDKKDFILRKDEEIKFSCDADYKDYSGICVLTNKRLLFKGIIETQYSSYEHNGFDINLYDITSLEYFVDPTFDDEDYAEMEDYEINDYKYILIQKDDKFYKLNVENANEFIDNVKNIINLNKD